MIATFQENTLVMSIALIATGHETCCAFASPTYLTVIGHDSTGNQCRGFRLHSTARQRPLLHGEAWNRRPMRWSYSLVGVFMMLGCGDVVGNIILSMPGGRWGAFAAIMLVTFLLGFFIDWIGILFIIVPIVSPLAPTLGFDPVWFGIMICVNLQMAFNTPPLAPAIFFVRGCAPEELGVSTADIIRGIVPFVGLIILGLAICVVFPQVITWLPNMMIK